MSEKELVVTPHGLGLTDHENIVLAGPWCVPLGIEDWHDGKGGNDFSVVPYHWDNRDKLHSDYLHLQQTYEISLKIISDYLNEVHRLEWSNRQWRILIGPWLSTFLECLFDRYSVLVDAVNYYPNLFLLTPPEKSNLGANSLYDTEQFLVNVVRDDFNQYLFNSIAYTFPEIECREGTIDFLNLPVEVSKQKSLYLKIFQYLQRPKWRMPTDTLFIDPYVQGWERFKLNLKINKSLSVAPPKYHSNDFELWREKREELATRFKYCAVPWLAQCREIFADYFPNIYFEGFASLTNWGKKQYGNPVSNIATSIGFESNEGFKAWLASCIGAGSRLSLFQHGGHDGTGAWSSTEVHQLTISDRYYSWGWKDGLRRSDNIKPFAAGKLSCVKNRRAAGRKEKKALWVWNPMPRYSYRLYSVPVGNASRDYFNDQKIFWNALSERIKRQLLLRLHHRDYGWDQKNWVSRHLSGVQLANDEQKFTELLYDTSCYIVTFNTTVLIECFVMNRPTVAFWEPGHWELRDSAKAIYKKLESVGILYRKPETAAQLLNQHYSDMDSWWCQSNIKQAVDEFLDHYGRTSEDWCTEIVDLFSEKKQKKILHR